MLKNITALNYDCFLNFKENLFDLGMYVNLNAIWCKIQVFLLAWLKFSQIQKFIQWCPTDLH